MVELAVVGTVVNVLTLIDFACKTVHRIQEFTETATGLPEVLSDTIIHIAVLPGALEKLKNHRVSQEKEIIAVLNGFNKTIGKLEERMKKITPFPNDKWSTKAGKALRSFRAEKEITKLTGSLQVYYAQLTAFLGVNGLNVTTVTSVVTLKQESINFRAPGVTQPKVIVSMAQSSPLYQKIGMSRLLPLSTTNTPVVLVNELNTDVASMVSVEDHSRSLVKVLCNDMWQRRNFHVMIEMSWNTAKPYKGAEFQTNVCSRRINKLINSTEQNVPTKNSFAEILSHFLDSFGISCTQQGSRTFVELPRLFKEAIESIHCRWLIVIDDDFLFCLCENQLLDELPQSSLGGIIFRLQMESVKLLSRGVHVPETIWERNIMLETINHYRYLLGSRRLGPSIDLPQIGIELYDSDSDSILESGYDLARGIAGLGMDGYGQRWLKSTLLSIFNKRCICLD